MINITFNFCRVLGEGEGEEDGLDSEETTSIKTKLLKKFIINELERVQLFIFILICSSNNLKHY